jgi:hypothetical protein
VSLGPANILQFNSGTATGVTSAGTAVTLPAGVAATSTLLMGVQHRSSASGVGLNTPGSWFVDASAGAAQTSVYLFRQSVPTAGASSWLVGPGTGTSTLAWWIAEVDGLDQEAAFDVAATSAADTDPQPSGTTGNNSAVDCIAFAVFGSATTTEVAPTWSGYSNGFVELAQSATGASAGSTNVSVAGAYAFPATQGPVSGTALQSGSTGQLTQGLVVVYRAAIAKSYFPIVLASSFDFGTMAGQVSGGVSGLRPADVSANATVTAAAAHTGGYGLRLTAAGTIAQYGWTYPGAIQNGPNRGTCTLAMRIRVNSATGTVVIARILEDNAGSEINLVYNASTNKLGTRFGTSGTVAYQGDTLPMSNWAHVELRFRGLLHPSTRWCEWMIGEVSQPEPTPAGASQGAGLVGLQFGFNVAQTCQVDYDDLRIGQLQGDYPLGEQAVIVLGVDGTATPTISGTTTNFQTFTANGTMAAWNAATAVAAVDELPPTIGASADGVAQVAAAASDYMEFPMATYTLQPDEVISGVRVVVVGWAAGSPAAATIGVRGWDGTTETVLMAVQNPAFTNSTTAPGWYAGMWETPGGWTQTKLDAACVRLGFSTDASPAIGAHAIYLEVVITKPGLTSVLKSGGSRRGG